MPNNFTICLAGDVMTGRGVDQIMTHPSDPLLYESYITHAGDYLKLAQQLHGTIPKAVPGSYIWGEFLKKICHPAVKARVINLETSITVSEDFWPQKGIHYRMHPFNIGCLQAAGIDCCTLANNHVLDWGYGGLDETIRTLKAAKIKYTGAGADLEGAQAPAIMEISAENRLLVFGCGTENSGIPPSWGAAADRPGVNLLTDLSAHTVQQIGSQVDTTKQAGDVVMVSIHWGGNWGYNLGIKAQKFAHDLIDRAGVDIIHGHSSHHVKGIEVYQGKLILYGCGDLITDYEGISGHRSYRSDLGLLYFPSLECNGGAIVEMNMVPTRNKKFQLQKTSDLDIEWLQGVLQREGRLLGTSTIRTCHEDHSLKLVW